MLLGLSLDAFTQLHVVLSLVGIAAGLVVAAAMLAGQRPAAWTAVFLATTVLTSVTGFMFPAAALLPSHIFGVISLVALAGALFALYGRNLAGPFRGVYIVTALLALYLNCFVGVVQAFLKLGFLQGVTQLHGVAQGILFVAFLALGYRVWKNFPRA